jgi:hypothetical protein
MSRTKTPATSNITELAAFFPANAAPAAAKTVTAKPKGRVSNRFTEGTGMYACRHCGRNTRDTGRGDNDGVKLCTQCYDLAGYENLLMDSKVLSDSDKHAVNELLRQLSTFIGRKAYDLHPELVAAVVAAPNSGVNPEKIGRAVLKDIATATPKRTQEAQKPGPGRKITVNTKARAKVVKAEPKAKAPKAAPAPEPTRYTDWMVWQGDTVVNVIFGADSAVSEERTPRTPEEAQKFFSLKYTQPVTVTTMEDGHKRNEYLKGLKKGKAAKAKATPKAKGEKAQKAGKKAPAAPKGDKGLSPTMIAELERIANGVYEDSKTASCARMHLKMRGLIEGNPTEGYTVTRPQ